MKKLVTQIAGFGVVGVLATAIDIGLLVILKEMFAFSPVDAAAISFIVSLLFNYWASMRFVFTRRDGMSRIREVLTFISLSAVGFCFNEAVMWVGTELVDVRYLVVKIVATAVVMVWNFWSRRQWLDGSGRDAP